MNLRRLVREYVPDAAMVADLVGRREPPKEAGEALFMQAPSLGLQYTSGGGYPPVTPLLGAGERRHFEHTLSGPLFGRLGGPTCVLGHYTYEIAIEDHEAYVERHDWVPHRFTVCAAEIGGPLGRLRGVYLRPRLSAIKLEDDWLAVGSPRHRVKLESGRFNDIYDLHRADGQDEVALRELFSPSFVVWLQEHPLKPGFECGAGTLVVFVRGYETAAGKITFLHEATRDIARRIERQLGEAAGPHFSAAGQTIL
ncbi:MAG TPA: hypothetical protein VF517_08805 [Thermoleophilaceae bacterium]